MKRDFLAETDFTTDEINRVFELCRQMKQGKLPPSRCWARRSAAFSTRLRLRTRISFEVGVAELGRQFTLYHRKGNRIG